MNAGSKFGETGVQLLRILYLGDDEDNTVGIQGNGFNHERNILCLKAEFDCRLLHHITKKALRLFCSISEFADFKFPVREIGLGQGAANLMVIHFFNFHYDHILNIKILEFFLCVTEKPVK